MHSEIVKSTDLVMYINFFKVAKFNYLKKVNIHYYNRILKKILNKNSLLKNIHYFVSARVLTIEVVNFHSFIFRE